MTASPPRLLLLLLLALLPWVRQAAGAEEGVEFFENRIRPLLSEHCYECHGAEKRKGGLRLDSRKSIIEGGDSGPAFSPGDPGKSLIVTAVRYLDPDLQMPPPKKGIGRQLSVAQIDDLVTWVKLGAPLPEEKATPVHGPHWAFEPIANPPPPATGGSAWPKTAIDSFILARLEAAGLQPAPPADRRTLIRRATFDLTGLPPTVADVEAFLNDQTPDAFARVVDRLLASPRYGERWGRHWLDTARYSDTKGYVYGREERFFVHAPAYRDWVIRSLNDGLPYDRFLLLQMAADQLVPNGSPDLAAMGFLTGGRRFTGITHEIIDDRIDVVTRGTMALTVQCARCHDHKYDPIPTQDYYSLYGVFQSSAERLVPIGESISGEQAEAFKKGYDERAAKLVATMQKRRSEAGERLRARVGEYLAAQFELQKYPEEGFDQVLSAGDLIPASVRRWRDFLDRTKNSEDPIFAVWHALTATAADGFEASAAKTLSELRARSGNHLNARVLSTFETPPKSLREVAARYGELFAAVEKHWQATCAEAVAAGVPEPARLPDDDAEFLRQFLHNPKSPTAVPDLAIVDNELFFPTSVCEELWKLQGELDRWIVNTPGAQPHALVLFDRDPEANPRVFRRGNPARRAEEVPRQFLSVLSKPGQKPFQNGSGRLELAQAIVHPENPLTARVAVNRIWLHHFGDGLVRTPSDFGLRSEKPIHPELLDFLARKFMSDGWSMKAMHRLIMLSAVYQQSSDPGDSTGSARASEIDPSNHLIWRFNRQRLDFEEMRDALLAVSGEMDLRMGGRATDMFDGKRRSVYGLIDRQFVPATLRIFDFASPDVHIAQRHETSIPQQGLFFLNHPFVADRARSMVKQRGFTEAASDALRIRLLYNAAVQRTPTSAEAESSLRFLTAAAAKTSIPPKPPESPWRYGWGDYDQAAAKVRTFHPFPYFSGSAWQGSSAWPDQKLGWAQLTAEGGHAGNDLRHAVIRRWIAPHDGLISVSGTVTHAYEPGDGIRAYVFSSRSGELKAENLHNSSAEMSIPSFEVKQGDTLDFIVDFAANLNSDMFQWIPTISELRAAGDVARAKWNAKRDFAGVPPAELRPLSPWEQLAQVLLLTNEFSFID